MRFFLLVLLFLLLVTPAIAQPLARVEGIGDTELREEVERVVGDRTEADSATSGNPLRDARRAATRAQRVLRSRGYYAASIETFVDAQDMAGIRIVPGPVYTVGQVTVMARDDTRAGEQAAAAIELSTGAPLRAEAVLSAETRGLVALHTSGWPDAQAAERVVTVDHASTLGDVVFRYNPGAFSRYGTINRDTGAWDPQFLARMSPFQSGEIANRNEMLEFQSRLDGLESVNSALVTLGPPDANSERTVNIELTAAPRHTVQVGASYSTTEGAGTEVTWKRRNMLGRDETLTLTGVAAELNQGLKASLSRPHWRRYRQTLFAEAGLVREDTAAYELVEASTAFSITRRSGSRRTYSAGVALEASDVSDALVEQSVVTAKLPLAAAYDSRNNPLDATSGFLASIELAPARTFGDLQSTYARIQVRGAVYQRLTSSLVAAARLRVGSLQGVSVDQLPIDERFFAGGGGSVRGYGYQSIGPRSATDIPLGGLSVVETAAELRWRVRDRWGVVGFVDAASVDPGTSPEFGNMRAAAGIGVRYHFDFAPVRFDIATPLDRRDGDGAIQVYFSLGQAF
ncbi:autotransporter assembly complex protein TamA [Maricaulis sp. CAU 1757]